MPRTDDIARRMVSTQVGAIRAGNRLYSSLEPILDDADDTISVRLRRGRPVVQLVKSAASEIGKKIEEEVDQFADARLEYLLKIWKSESGLDLKEPKDIGSLRVMKGSVSKFMEDAVDSARGRARMAVEDEEEDPSIVTRALRAHVKTVSASGINAAHNAAVIAIARANKQAIQGVLALATLDNRTTELCMERHGGAWDIVSREPLAFSTIAIQFPGRPPWHFRCRTTLTPVFVGDIPTEETMDREAWFDTVEAREAFGEEQIDSFLEGQLSHIDLITGIQ